MASFDALFDVYFPRLVGDGTGSVVAAPDEDSPVRDNAQALADFRAELLAALADDDQEALARLAVEMVGRFGAMPGRGSFGGLSLRSRERDDRARPAPVNGPHEVSCPTQGAVP